MRIAFNVDLHGSPDEPSSAPTWDRVKEQVLAAEAVGFDAAFVPDHLLYQSEARDDASVGAWESVSFAAALAASTSSVEIGHSMFNTPYRSPALVAKIAESLDEISGGRYILGLGAGNTPDYRAFGFVSDHRYSRFAEAVEIIHGLLKGGAVDFEGRYHSARDAELVLRGPRAQGPPVVIAAWGPRMMRLAARFADEWNGWSEAAPTVETFRPMVEQLERACEEVDREPRTLRRSLDISVDPSGSPSADAGDGILTGTSDEVAEHLLDLQAIGIGEVRCYLRPATGTMLERIEAAADIVSRVHAG